MQIKYLKAGVAILIANKVNFKTKAITRDKEHYLMIKEVIKEECITLANIYAPNTEYLNM